MDQLIRQFAEKTPVHLLDKHRRLMQKFGCILSNNVVKSVLAAQNLVSENQPCEDCIMTGSMAEGASFARLFSPDSKTSSEMEADFMFPLVEWPEEKGLTYIDKNKAFVHIDGTVISTLVRSVFGEDNPQKIFCQKEDGMYLSNHLVKLEFKRMLVQYPNCFNVSGFRPCIADKRCDDGNAAVTFQGDEPDEVMDDEKLAESFGSENISFAIDLERREAEVSDRATDECLKLIKEILPCCEKFEIRIAEMLAHLQCVQDEFMVMRSDELSVPIYSQASKALEWAMICVDITDDIFDTRHATAGRILNASIGMNTHTLEEERREDIKQKLKMYIDQLAISEDDVSDVSAAAAICQLLSDIERTDIAPKRLLAIFRDYVNRQAALLKGLTYVDQHPQLRQIPRPLQQLSSCLKRQSMDFVPCLKLMFWPSVASEWKTRDRAWPAQSVIDEIVSKGVHLVGKAFCHDDIDWRLSFSVAEIDLATRWSPAQHFVYFIFKSLFYKFIKPLSSDTSTADVSPSKSSKTYLASYTAKTVMMWTSESVDQPWWTEDNAAECLTVLLLALQSAFECRTLDHYFVSSVNLLEGLPDVLASRVIDTVNSILADPAAIVDQLDSHFERTEVFFNAMPAQIESLNSLSEVAELVSSSFGCSM